MKKLTLLTLVLCLAILPAAFSQADQCQEDLTVHGTVQFVGVSGGCWKFVGDDGNNYELFTNKGNILKDGLTGTLHGDIMDGLIATHCQVGIPTEVCHFDVDMALHGTGTLNFIPCLEGGCWIFTMGNQNYQPFSQDPSFYEHGAHIQVDYTIRDDMASFCQVGPIMEIFDFTILQDGEETPTCGGGPILVE